MFLIPLFIGNLFSASYNTYGVLGYINTPSAYNNIESSVGLILSRNYPDRKYMFTASPFNWLDANIFYSDITGKRYGANFKQSYKDKGFSLKLTYPNQVLGHTFAAGINDLAGTGLYSSEYLVFSNRINKLEYSVGIGWGEYQTGLDFRNPLIKIDKDFNSRSADFKDEGGVLDFNNYYSGPNSSIFIGMSYKLNDNLTFLVETDPTNLNGNIPYPEEKNSLNIGFETKRSNYSFKSSLIRGNKLHFQFAFSDNFLNFNPNQVKKDRSKISNFSEIQYQLQKHNIGLMKIEKKDKTIILSARQNSYFNQHEVNDLIYFYAHQIADDQDFKEIIVRQFYNGMETNRTSHQASLGFATRREDFTKENISDTETIYSVKDNFPYIYTQFSPKLRNYIAAREGFYFGGLFIENNTQVILNDSFHITGNFKLSIYDNFSELYIPPVNTYPAQVRSDQKEYFNSFGDGVTIGRLEANYLKSFNRRHFFRTTVGIFEEMYGGVGVDYVYHKEGSLISFFGETYFVKKRNSRMLFDFKKYSNSYARIGAQIREPMTKTDFKISYGEYLAGDIGYTFEAKRRFANGVEFSAFFTKTNVSYELFGEGSFDKGVRFKIPIKSLFGDKILTTYEWRPLMKDPGALLIKSMDLQEIISRQRYY